MTLSPSTLALHERRFQAVVVGGLVTVFAIVALAPHSERALFEEGRLPSAFAAVVTDPVVPLLRRFGTMEPEAFARAFHTGRPTGARPDTRTMLPGLISVAAGQPPAFLAPVDGVAPSPVADRGVLGPQGNLDGFRQTSFTSGFTSGSGIGSGSGMIGTGVDSLAPAGTGPPVDPVDPVSPIPEPASWIMILSGMALIGFFTRRARIGAGAID